MLRRPLLILLPLLLGVAALPAQRIVVPAPWTEESRRELVAWTRTHAIPLDGLRQEATPETLRESLAPLLRGKDLVLLGEPDHSIDERHDFRLLFLRLLHERGFHDLGLDMGRSDGAKVDRYLATGEPRWLERTALAGDRTGLREDRDDALPDFDPRAHPDLHRRMLSGSHWLYRELRNLAGTDSPRWQSFGYDVAFLPGAGYLDAKSALDALPTNLAEPLRSRIARVPGESRSDEAARLEACLDWLGNVEFPTSAEQIVERRLRPTLESLAASLRFNEAARSDGRQRLAALRDRSRFTAQRCSTRIDSAPQGTRLAILGHALQLSKASTSLRLGPIPMWQSLGTRLAERMQDRMLVVWFLYDSGTRAEPRTGATEVERPSLKNSLESVLARAGDCFVLPLESTDPLPTALREPHLLSMGGTGVTATLARHCDVICFLREVHAPRLRR